MDIENISDHKLQSLLRKHGHTFRTCQNKRNEPLIALRKELYRRNRIEKKAELIRREENRLKQIETVKKMDIDEDFRKKLLKMYDA